MKRYLRKAQGREARNEQRKLTANLFNALAIALVVTGLAGPFLNPVIASELGAVERIGMLAIGALIHICARLWLHDIEDKSG